jgi:hypothetical protein
MHKKKRRHSFVLFEPAEPRRLFSAALPPDPSPADEPPTPPAEPDLTVSVPQLFPPSTRVALAAGDPATVSVTLSNVGGADAPSSFTGQVVLSRDAIFSSDDLVLTTFQAANLPAGSSVPITANVTLPDSPTDDVWYAIAVVDAENASPDLDRANNTAVGNPRTLPAKRFTLLSVDLPPSVRPGQSFTLTGTALVTGLHTDDPNFLSASVRRPGLTIQFQPDLAPLSLPISTDGSTNPNLLLFSSTLTLPADAPPGPYTLDLSPVLFKGTVSIDPSYIAPTFHVAADAPFLSITTPRLVAGTSHIDAPFTVSLTAGNTGDAATAPSTLTYYLSATPTLSDDAQLLGTSFVASLAPGDTRNLNPSFTPSLPAGHYYLITTLTSSHAGAFAGTSTTTSAAIPLNLVTPADPDPTPGPDPDPDPTPDPNPDPTPGPVVPPTDLALSDLAAPATATTNSTLRITADPSVTGPLVRYYLSEDATLSPSAIPLGTLPAAVTTSLRVPANLAPGTYHLIATIDPDDAIDESDESNNTAVTPATIRVVASDLRGTLTPKPAAVRTGDPATLLLSLTNPNNKTIKRNYNVTFYLSDDKVFSPDDSRFSRQKFSLVLNKKQSGARALNYKLPLATPLGTRFVIAVLDTPKPVAQAHLELTSKPLKITAPKLTAQIRSLQRRGPSTLVTLRLTNTGTAAQTAPVTVQLNAASQQKPLLITKRPLTLAPKKFVQFTLTLPGKAKLDASTLSATIL